MWMPEGTKFSWGWDALSWGNYKKKQVESTLESNSSFQVYQLKLSWIFNWELSLESDQLLLIFLVQKADTPKYSAEFCQNSIGVIRCSPQIWVPNNFGLVYSTCPDSTCHNLTCTKLTCPNLTIKLDLSRLDQFQLALSWLDLSDLTCPILTCPEGTFLTALRHLSNSPKIPSRHHSVTIQTTLKHFPDTLQTTLTQTRHNPSRHLLDTFQTPTRHIEPSHVVKVRWGFLLFLFLWQQKTNSSPSPTT